MCWNSPKNKRNIHLPKPWITLHQILKPLTVKNSGMILMTSCDSWKTLSILRWSKPLIQSIFLKNKLDLVELVIYLSWTRRFSLMMLLNTSYQLRLNLSFLFLLMHYSSCLQLYKNYLQRQEEILLDLELALKSHKPFEAMYRDFEKQKVCYLPLNAFLLKPAQRVLHYRLIMERKCN